MIYKYFTLSILVFIFQFCHILGNNQKASGDSVKKDLLFRAGFNYFKTNNLVSAKNCFLREKNSSIVLGNYARVEECLYYLSAIAVRENRLIEANGLLDALNKISVKYHVWHPLVMEGNYLKGSMLLKDKKIADAYKFYSTLTTLLKQHRCADSTLAKIYHEKGTVEYYKGDFMNSLQSYNESIEHGSKAFGSNSVFVSDQINNLGVINYMLARYDDALVYYRKSESILHLTKSKDNNAFAGTYSNIGLIFLDKNDLTNARMFFEKARDLYLKDRLTGTGDIAHAYINLSVVFDRLGLRDLQMKNINNALTYCLKSQTYLLPKIYFQMASYYETSNNFPMARNYFSMAIVKAKEVFGESSDLAYAHNNLGDFFIRHNIDVNLALSHFLLARNFFLNTVGEKHPSMASSYIHIGGYYQKTGQLEKALKSYHCALISITENFTNSDPLTFSYDTKSLSEGYSIDILKAKAQVLEKLSNKTTDKKLKTIYLQSAFFHYKQAIRYIEQVRENYFSEESRFVLSEKERGTYLNTIRLAYQLYQVTGNFYFKDNAFMIADNAHSASLQTMIRQKSAYPAGANYPLFNKELELKKELSLYNEWIDREKSSIKPDLERIHFWNEKVAAITVTIEELISRINKEHPVYRYFFHSDKNPQSFTNIQRKLGDSEALIEYFIADSVLYSFCITGKQADMRQISINSNFFDDIQKVLSFVKFPTVVAADSLLCLHYQKSANDLFNLLIKPYLKQIKNKSLIIVPDSKLTYLPFCTLLTQPIDKKTLNFKEFPYLIKQYPVRYLYASGLINRHDDSHASKLFLGIAPSYEGNGEKMLMAQNPTRGNEWGRLLFNKMEVESALGYMSGKGLYTSSASEEIFKHDALDYRILHLAMHGTTDDENPLYSKLIFTPHSSTTEDDNLYGYETYNLKLNTDLLVLSACNTGTGQIREGEGILSLTRGFTFAGVKSIVMTMWEVNDKSGFSIVDRFYRNLVLYKPKDLALQQSKVDYLRASDILHAHPYFWAGYVLIGDNTPIDCTNSYAGLIYWIAFIIVISGIILFILKRKRNRIIKTWIA